MITVLISGGFDPLHSGHIAYIKSAASLGDRLLVALNSDEWLTRKKGKPFMPFKERQAVLQAINGVDMVFGFDDSDNTAIEAIKYALELEPSKLIFANGGDRQFDTTPELDFCADYHNISCHFGVGGSDKANSSSWLLDNWSAPKVIRNWGYYRNLYKGVNCQVKELVINPYSRLSMQRHKHRSETWNLVSGQAHIITAEISPKLDISSTVLTTNTPVNIPSNYWHQGCNDSDSPAHIIEIWKGPSDLLSEQDIERYLS
jgi:cytidyltransferase-like protein